MATLGLVERDARTGAIGKAPKRNELEGFFVPFAVAMVLSMIVMAGSAPMLQNVTQDKSQRIVEMLLGAAKPLELMMGRVLGAVAVSLTSSLLYVVVGVIAVSALGLTGLLPLSIIPWFYVYLLLDVTMLCSFAAALGAACSTPQDAQNLAIVLLAPVMIQCLPWSKSCARRPVLWLRCYRLFLRSRRSSCCCARPCRMERRHGSHGPAWWACWLSRSPPCGPRPAFSG